MRRGVRLRYLKRIRKPGGAVYVYLARPGRKMQPLPDLPENHPRFVAAYHEAWEKGEEVARAPRAQAGTLSALCASWRASHEFRSLAPTTRANKAAIIKRLEARVGHVQVAAIEPRHIRRDLEKQPPHAANNLLKVWRKLMRHAKRMDWRPDDPAREVERVPTGKSRGFHTWTLAEIDRFKARHPAGSMARLALYLLLCLGRRRSEVVGLGPQHVEDGGIWVHSSKTATSEDERLWLPLHPELAQEIALHQDRMIFLTTQHGKPFASGNAFGNWWKDRCIEAGLPHWGTHGGRKAVATFLAEAGATAHQIMAVTGHRTLAQVEVYTRAARQRHMATQGVALLDFVNRAGAVSENGEKPNKIKG